MCGVRFTATTHTFEKRVCCREPLALMEVSYVSRRSDLTGVLRVGCFILERGKTQRFPPSIMSAEALH